MVGRGDEDRVDVLAVEHLAEVARASAAVCLNCFASCGGGLGDLPVVDVAERHELRARLSMSRRSVSPMPPHPMSPTRMRRLAPATRSCDCAETIDEAADKAPRAAAHRPPIGEETSPRGIAGHGTLRQKGRTNGNCEPIAVSAGTSTGAEQGVEETGTAYSGRVEGRGRGSDSWCLPGCSGASRWPSPCGRDARALRRASVAAQPVACRDGTFSVRVWHRRSLLVRLCWAESAAGESAGSWACLPR